MSEMASPEERIKLEVQAGLVVLAPHLSAWVRTHLIEPRPVQLSVKQDGSSLQTFWLVTHHVGTNDSSYRIVYDENEQAFGLELTLDDGVEWYMGIYGTFAETVMNM